jgi:DNA-binding winged helix-turn-helix (wHTH) protein/tetratricopeptide (TPR) repeat protein
MSNAERLETSRIVDFAQERERRLARAGDLAPIVLAHEVPFAVGPLTIDPAQRRIAHADGREDVVEPRVMQVLVALARANGAVLSRDDLIQLCWEGRIVGDDAINRIISRLRRSAAAIGNGVFRIETLTKVGYRLVREDAEAPGEGAPTELAPASGGSHAWRVTWLAAAGGALLLALAAIFFLVLRPNAAPTIPSIAVLGEAGSPESADLARNVAADLSRLAAARATDLAIVEASRAETANYLARIAGQRRGARLWARATLAERATGTLLWSAEFDRPLTEATGLRQQVAAKLGDVLLCALHGSGAGEGVIDLAALRLFLVYCDRAENGMTEDLLATVRQVTERAPGFAPGWAGRALVEGALGMPDHATGNDDARRRGYRVAAWTHLQRARAIDPTIVEAYLAESRLLMVEPARWAERLAILDRGLAATPDAALSTFRSKNLFSVGRIRDAVESSRRAAMLNPLSPNYRGAAALGLAHAGDVEAARQEIATAEALWPGVLQIRAVRFAFERDFGDPLAALAMLDDSRNFTFLGSPEERDVIRLFLRARDDPTPANIDASLASYDASLRGGPRAGPGYSLALSQPDLRLRGGSHVGPSYLQALVRLGRIDEAFRLASRPELGYVLRKEAAVLFYPHMRPIRRDPRFMALARHLGLLQYWRSSGIWPDFCSEPDLPYDCRAEARRLP